VSTPRETVSAFTGIVFIQATGLAYKNRIRKREREREKGRGREKGSAKSVGECGSAMEQEVTGGGHPNRSHLLGGALRKQ